jgi:lysyl-tRNA synthetase class 1
MAGKKTGKPSKSLFWADQIADEVVKRKSFHYVKKPVPKLKEYVIKTSASLSGILHIGRLSDTIRGESVHRALVDAGVKSRLIWVAEDMDPMRKVPKGVPASYSKYIGMPVTDIPDPHGCHKSYAEHHVSEYFKVIDSFVKTKMQKFSMRQEYKRGEFGPYIKKLMENIDEIIKIQNRYRSEPLPKEWSPWQPICENCGKIITTTVSDFSNGVAHYECRNYSFENTRAKGCGHKGENDPMKFNGKLMWKSEWAAQWARWKVVSEGAGKEYQVPMSAWWVNGEIVERVLEFPMPKPIFYEHIMIDGEKMSASKGNVVYPSQWLEVAPAELLRYFYNKKLMKTRSFSWKDLPILYDDYDDSASIYFGKKKLKNKHDEKHIKRLFGVSQLGRQAKPDMSFDMAVALSQIPGKKGERIAHARNWVEKYAPEMRIELQDKVPSSIVRKLNSKQKAGLSELAKLLKKKPNEDKLYNSFWDISKSVDIPVRDLFKGVYLALIAGEQGPRLAPFILAIGTEKVAKVLKQVK